MKNDSKIGKILLPFLMTFFFLILAGCTDDDFLPPDYEDHDTGSFTITAKYDSIRSSPGGGGIFVLKINPSDDFAGSVVLSLEADPLLNAVLTKTRLSKNDNVVEITIHPDRSVIADIYRIKLKAVHAGKQKDLILKARIYMWDMSNFEEHDRQLEKFKDWLLSKDPAYADAFAIPLLRYETYPEILIVEHVTYLTQKYEVRFCYHVMIPPHDWSMICLRKRGSFDAEIAAKRESDGTIAEIPLNEYPSFNGY